MRIKMTNFYDKLLARLNRHPHWDPIIVYQMGKVGSASVQRSLIATFKSMGINVPVHHIHNLYNLEALEKSVLQSKVRHNPEDTLMGIRLGLALKKQMDENPNQRWNLVSLVRDPVARNISDFFHGLQEIIPDYWRLYQEGQLSIEQLQNTFFSKFDHHLAPYDWFDSQMKTVFDIDVYTQPFPTRKGYEIYRERKLVRLLLIRLEDLNRVANQAMKKFLRIENFHLLKSNIGADKQYATLYREFKKRPLPSTYLEKKYSTKYAKHFYTSDELEQFYRKWTSPGEK